jgi:hypothetical protein
MIPAGDGRGLPVFTRLAVTPQQITELSLPTAPAKGRPKSMMNLRICITKKVTKSKEQLFFALRRLKSR